MSPPLARAVYQPLYNEALCFGSERRTKTSMHIEEHCGCIVGGSYPRPAWRRSLGRVVGKPDKSSARTPHLRYRRLPDGMRRPVSTGCVTLPMIDVLLSTRKGDR